jgi:hypothetical protein
LKIKETAGGRPPNQKKKTKKQKTKNPTPFLAGEGEAAALLPRP